jgi:hypothetical protein
VNLSAIVKQLKKERDREAQQLSGLNAASLLRCCRIIAPVLGLLVPDLIDYCGHKVASIRMVEPDHSPVPK